MTARPAAGRRGRIPVLWTAAALLVAGCSGEFSTPAGGSAGTMSTVAAELPNSSIPATATPPESGRSTIPSDLLLPDEGERSTLAEVTDWTTDNSVGQAWLLDPCRPTAYPTDRQRSGFRTVSRTGPELRQARQLAQYPTVDDAVEAVAGFRRALGACATGGTPAEGSAWRWVFDDVEIGDEGIAAASTVGGPGFAPAGTRIAVTRVGSRVFLAYDEGEYSTAELDGGAGAVQRVAGEFAGSR